MDFFKCNEKLIVRVFKHKSLTQNVLVKKLYCELVDDINTLLIDWLCEYINLKLKHVTQQCPSRSFIIFSYNYSFINSFKRVLEISIYDLKMAHLFRDNTIYYAHSDVEFNLYNLICIDYFNALIANDAQVERYLVRDFCNILFKTALLHTNNFKRSLEKNRLCIEEIDYCPKSEFESSLKELLSDMHSYTMTEDNISIFVKNGNIVSVKNFLQKMAVVFSTHLENTVNVIANKYFQFKIQNSLTSKKKEIVGLKKDSLKNTYDEDNMLDDEDDGNNNNADVGYYNNVMEYENFTHNINDDAEVEKDEFPSVLHNDCDGVPQQQQPSSTEDAVNLIIDCASLKSLNFNEKNHFLFLEASLESNEMVESLLFSKRNEISWNIGTEFEVVKILLQIQDAFLQKCIENNVIYGFYFEQWYDTLHTVVIVSIFIPIIMLDSSVSLYKRYCKRYGF